MKRPRNRRRCKRHDVNIAFQLLQLLLVCHAKTLLLINDEQTEIFILHVL